VAKVIPLLQKKGPVASVKSCPGSLSALVVTQSRFVVSALLGILGSSVGPFSHKGYYHRTPEQCQKWSNVLLWPYQNRVQFVWVQFAPGNSGTEISLNNPTILGAKLHRFNKLSKFHGRT